MRRFEWFTNNVDDDVLWGIFTHCAILRFYHRWKIGIRPKMSSEDTFHFHTFCSPWASPFFEKDKRRKSKSIEEQFSGCWRFWEFKRTTTFSLITIYCGRTELINDVRKSFSNDDLWTEIWRWWSFLQAWAKKGSRSKWAFLFLSSTLFENHKKVSFNIASEASYVYILSGQKLIKKAKNGQLWRVFENLKFEVKQLYQTSHF